jgi:hypothetical protein
MTASALFIPSAAALWKRLSKHCSHLARYVVEKRCRSVEIVLAYLINIPWMPPGEHAADDETCLYISIALTIAIDLNLDKAILPHDAGVLHVNPFSCLPKADRIEDKRALCIDGFSHMDLTSPLAQRLLRRRERTWLSLWVLERGVCLARGRRFLVPTTPLVHKCDDWHLSSISDSHDASIISMTTLRRDLDGLIQSIRNSCDNLSSINIEADIANTMKLAIDHFFDRWFARWSIVLRAVDRQSLPPYIQILTSHTILSTYCMVITHPSAPAQVKSVFHTEALSSALKVMRTAVQEESQLISMPNNTATMVSFAACLAFKLANGLLCPRIKTLILETARVLQHIGNSPVHRHGVSSLHGDYLQEVLRQYDNHVSALDSEQASTRCGTTQAAGSVNDQHPVVAEETLLQFSAMSDEQIFNVVNEIDLGINIQLNGFGFDGLPEFDWLN